MVQLPFKDRSEAGRLLAERLAGYKGRHALVLAVPRGGVAVAYEIARALDADLDVIVAHKVGAPGNPEYAIGVVVETDDVLLSEEEIRVLGIPRQYVDQEVERQKREIQRRVQLYRRGRPLPDLSGRTVIVVDDGIATGFTLRGALQGIRSRRPGELVLAVPVAPPQAIQMLSPHVDKLVCLATPEPFIAIGLWYREFPQVTDEEVLRYLSLARSARTRAQVGNRRLGRRS